MFDWNNGMYNLLNCFCSGFITLYIIEYAMNKPLTWAVRSKMIFAMTSMMSLGINIGMRIFIQILEGK